MTLRVVFFSRLVVSTPVFIPVFSSFILFIIPNTLFFCTFFINLDSANHILGAAYPIASAAVNLQGQLSGLPMRSFFDPTLKGAVRLNNYKRTSTHEP